MFNLKLITAKCKAIREREKKTQLDISLDTNYCISNISNFENGINNNLKLFLWYLALFNYDDLIEFQEEIKRGLAEYDY